MLHGKGKIPSSRNWKKKIPNNWFETLELCRILYRAAIKAMYNYGCRTHHSNLGNFRVHNNTVLTASDMVLARSFSPTFSRKLKLYKKRPHACITNKVAFVRFNTTSANAKRVILSRRPPKIALRADIFCITHRDSFPGSRARIRMSPLCREVSLLSPASTLGQFFSFSRLSGARLIRTSVIPPRVRAHDMNEERVSRRSTDAVRFFPLNFPVWCIYRRMCSRHKRRRCSSADVYFMREV